MGNRRITLAALMAFSLIVLWLSGPFEDFEKKSADGPLFTPSPGLTESGSQTPPVATGGSPLEEGAFRYEKVSLNTADGPIVMHILQVDMKNLHVGVKPVSSHRTLFGYEYLSVMAGSVDALAAVNSGFSYPNGLPGGMFYSNEILKIPASGRFPVLFLMENQAVITDAEQNISLKSGESVLQPVFFNRYSNDGGLYVFTPVYGSSDRIEKPHLCAIVKNGKVFELRQSETAQEIPSDGFLVAALGADAEKKLQSFIEPGSLLEYKTELKTATPLQDEYLSAYECGSRLIKDGVDVCPDYDPWAAGLLTREPRTAVGIKSDGTLLFAVIDGRGKEVSIGATGPELVRLLLERDVYQAALLDGGASSEMIIGGNIVNSPSAGRERLLSSCFVVFKR